MTKPSLKPASSVPPLTGYIGIVAALFFFFLWPEGIIDPVPDLQPVIFLLMIFIVMAVYELAIAKTYKAPDAKLDFSRKRKADKGFWGDFALKMLGLFVSLTLVVFYYMVADIYHDSWYSRFFDFVLNNAAIIGAVVFSYFIVIHFYLTDLKDSYWQLGRFVLTFGREGDRKLLKGHVLALAIKAFFLPLMFCYFVDDWDYLRGFDWSASYNFGALFNALYRFLFFIDLAFVVIGYVMTARLFNAHIRWTEERIGGWVVCLLCYMPFWQVFGRSYLDYWSGGIGWQQWLSGNELLFLLWGGMILLFSAIYVLSEAQFGLRFSNLTYRGLVSHGTFRFTKHPAYISKNISWWMLDVPFIATDWTLAFRNTMALVGVNLVYWLRAKYEERCLDDAPEYREYKDYIDRKGLFSFCKISALPEILKKSKKN